MSRRPEPNQGLSEIIVQVGVADHLCGFLPLLWKPFKSFHCERTSERGTQLQTLTVFPATLSIGRAASIWQLFVHWKQHWSVSSTCMLFEAIFHENNGTIYGSTFQTRKMPLSCLTRTEMGKSRAMNWTKLWEPWVRILRDRKCKTSSRVQMWMVGNLNWESLQEQDRSDDMPV